MSWKEIASREEGSLFPNSFPRRFRSRRISSLHLSNFKEFVSPHRGAVNSLQVDLTEGRYLLSAASDASAAVFDVQRPSDFEAGGLLARHNSIFVIDKQHEQGHKYAISSAAWYPVDTGLFVTGSFDHYINVWDTNTTQVVVNFKMPGKVYKTAMSAVATTHMLIAAGTEDVQVRLCDIASGAFAHTLSGHRVSGDQKVSQTTIHFLFVEKLCMAKYGTLDIPLGCITHSLKHNDNDGVMTIEWSTSSEWVLMTGGCDGAIRFWDIRRAGCFRVLDQSKTQFGRRPPVLERSTISKVAMSRETAQSSSAKSRGQQQKKVPSNGTKFSSMSKTPAQLKGSVKQRLHPGMISSEDRATAHYGAITGLKTTDDGMYLISAGSDSRLRLWDIESGCNTLVNFETARLQNSKGIQLAVAQDASLVFAPCMTSVKAFDLWSGQTSLTFRGHYECTNCCLFAAQDQELYTGGNDKQILVWSPSKPVTEEMHKRKGGFPAQDEDNWSD